MVESGLNESVATLTLISGIGSTFAGRLSSHGVNDIEELASADLSSLCAIKGVSEKRAQEWVWEAAETVADKYAFWFKDVGPNIEVESHSWPASVDPYRLRRALDLDVQKPSTNSFLVSGGLEPHKVQDEGGSLSCDCADAAKGNLCKHVLAIRLRTGDSQLQHLADRLTESKKQDISLFDLWYDYSAR
jgi:helicase